MYRLIVEVPDGTDFSTASRIIGRIIATLDPVPLDGGWKMNRCLFSFDTANQRLVATIKLLESAQFLPIRLS